MPVEPSIKRAFVFFDGQNLFHQAKAAFGYPYPNYDPTKLAAHVCASERWEIKAIHFYTGVPSDIDKPFWHHFWSSKMAIMGTRGVRTFSRPLRYRNQAIALPDGSSTVALVGQEKGVDVRIALDIVRYALENLYDVALIFS